MFPTVCHASFSFNVLVALMVPWVLVVTLVWSQFLHCRGLHTLFSHRPVPNRHTILFLSYLINFLFVSQNISRYVAQNISKSVSLLLLLLLPPYYSPVSNFYKVPLCHISIICFCPSKYFWTYFTWYFEAVFSLSKKYAAILSSASICFKESEVKHQIYFICYSSTLLFLWGKFDLCRLHSFWDLTQYALTLYCFYFLQCNLSCRAIHIGPVLPALFGTSEDPTTVPGSYDHLGCWNLMLNKKITWETSIWLSHCTISLGRMVISRNDVFQFDLNFTLLLFRSFLHLSLCFIDRRSTPHNMSSLIKIFSKYKFSQRNFFSQKSQLFFFFTPPVQERKVHIASISACQYLHLSV